MTFDNDQNVPVAELTRRLTRDGGFTWYPVAHNAASRFHNANQGGFSVSVLPADQAVTFPATLADPDGMTMAGAMSLLYERIVRHAKPLGDHVTAIGGWVDNGKVYLDHVLITWDKTEALKIAAQNDQLAIFDFAKSESVFLPRD